MSGIRDFSNAAYEGIKHAIDENDKDTMGVDDLAQIPLAWGDLIGRYVNMDTLVGDVRNYSDDIKDGHSKSAAELEAIWADVYKVDGDNAQAMAALNDELRAVVKEYAALAALLRPSGGRIPLQDMSLDGLRDYLMSNCASNERAYDRRMQEAVLALLDDPEFSQEVWDSLDDQGKQDLLERLLARVQEIMGTQINPEIVFMPQDHPDGWLGSYDPDTNQMIMYPRLFAKNRDFIMRSIFHEARHGYQSEAILDYNVADWISGGGRGIYRNYVGSRLIEIDISNGYVPRHPHVGQETAHAWTDNSRRYYEYPPDTFEEYVQQQREFDAWSFAGELEPGVFEELSHDTDILYRLRPPYSGSWHAPQR